MKASRTHIDVPLTRQGPMRLLEELASRRPITLPCRSPGRGLVELYIPGLNSSIVLQSPPLPPCREEAHVSRRRDHLVIHFY